LVLTVLLATSISLAFSSSFLAKYCVATGGTYSSTDVRLRFDFSSSAFRVKCSTATDVGSFPMASMSSLRWLSFLAKYSVATLDGGGFSFMALISAAFLSFSALSLDVKYSMAGAAASLTAPAFRSLSLSFSSMSIAVKCSMAAGLGALISSSISAAFFVASS